MEQAYTISRLAGISIPELLDAIAEAHAVKPMDIYEPLPPELIDKTTDTLREYIEAVKQLNK